jgi:hypothetical protein
VCCGGKQLAERYMNAGYTWLLPGKPNNLIHNSLPLSRDAMQPPQLVYTFSHSRPPQPSQPACHQPRPSSGHGRGQRECELSQLQREPA